MGIIFAVTSSAAAIQYAFDVVGFVLASPCRSGGCTTSTAAGSGSSSASSRSRGQSSCSCSTASLARPGPTGSGDLGSRHCRSEKRAFSLEQDADHCPRASSADGPGESRGHGTSSFGCVVDDRVGEDGIEQARNFSSRSLIKVPDPAAGVPQGPSLAHGEQLYWQR